MADEKFDYIIVGGGLSGCVLASRLSQAGQSVLLIEYGPDVRDHSNVKNPLLAGTLPATGLATTYLTVPQKYCDNRTIMNFAGRMLGGGSAANFVHWARPSSTDFEHWVSVSGTERWSFENLLPYMNKAEHWHDSSADPRFHGFDGPVYTNAGRKYPMRTLLKKALLFHGYKENLEPCGGSPLVPDNSPSFNTWTENVRILPDNSAERQFASYVYDLSRARILLNSPVRRVLIDERSNLRICTGVELVDGRVFYATQEVIVSTGGHKTPQLLMLSGIGPKQQLDAIGIPQILEAPDVGQNLYDHVGLFQLFNVKHPEKGFGMGSPAFNRPEFLHGHPLDYVARFNLSSDKLKEVLKQDEPGLRDDDPLLLPMRCHGSHMFCYVPVADLTKPRDGTLIGSLSLLLLPRSKGSITLDSANPLANPVTDPNYLSTHTDRYVLRETVRRLLRVAEAPSMAAELDGECPPRGLKQLTSQSSDKDIDARIRNECLSIYHPMGTAAMGKVVDADLKVRGVEGLRIVDASIFPSPISTMPQATLYGIAEMMADVILGKSSI